MFNLLLSKLKNSLSALIVPDEKRDQSSGSALEMVELHTSMLPLAITLLALFTTTVVCLIAVPWQQSVPGKGKVTVFSPMERPQSIEAQIDGRIKQWHVVEGQNVKAGELLLEISELNIQYLDSNQLERLKAQKEALQARQNAIEYGINAQQGQVSALGQLSRAAVPAAGVKIEQAQKQLLAANQKLVTAELNLKRRKIYTPKAYVQNAI